MPQPCQGSKAIIRAHSFPWQNLTNYAANLVNSTAHCGNTVEISRLHRWNSEASLNHELTSQIHVMNLWILQYSLINHHFCYSTITIKPKINVNKHVTELLWGHFLREELFEWKTSNSAEFRGKKTNSAVNTAAQNPRKNPNSAARLEIPRPAEIVGPTY